MIMALNLRASYWDGMMERAAQVKSEQYAG
jgi:hypothetical protein